MRYVYIVSDVCYEITRIVGVYSNKQSADKARGKYEVETKHARDHVATTVQRHEVKD